MKSEGPKSYQLKDMANVQVFADRQTDRHTEKQTSQKLYAPDLSMWGHKNSKALFNVLLEIVTKRINYHKQTYAYSMSSASPWDMDKNSVKLPVPRSNNF